MVNKYCIIGSPVAHSLSPLIYTYLYKRYNIIDCVYTVCEVSADNLDSFLKIIPIENIKGFNVTMPLKTEILSHLIYNAPGTKYGANTIIVSNKGLKGYSTDAVGFYKSLKQTGRDYTDNNIVFLGCGAVTRSLIADAVDKDAKCITVLNRTVSKIEDLKSPKIKIGDLNEYGNYLHNCDILINTTPIGMRHIKPTLDYSHLSQLPKAALVCDLIYDPPVTPLLKVAKSNGNPVLNGLNMLIWQAFYAFEIYFGIFPNITDFLYIKNIILSQKGWEEV